LFTCSQRSALEEVRQKKMQTRFCLLATRPPAAAAEARARFARRWGASTDRARALLPRCSQNSTVNGAPARKRTSMCLVGPAPLFLSPLSKPGARALGAVLGGFG
jgi:hypothetical protein